MAVSGLRVAKSCRRTPAPLLEHLVRVLVPPSFRTSYLFCEAVYSGQSTCVPATMWETRMELLSPGFNQNWPWLLASI